jgi:hypothetical protein
MHGLRDALEQSEKDGVANRPRASANLQQPPFFSGRFNILPIRDRF